MTWEGLLAWLLDQYQAASPVLLPLFWVTFFIVLIALWVKWRGWRKLKAFVKWLQSAIALVDQLLKLTDDVTYIKKQLTNNGGTTVKDVGQQTAKAVAELRDEVVSLKRSVASASRKATSATKIGAETQTIALATQRMLIDHLQNSTSEGPKR